MKEDNREDPRPAPSPISEGETTPLQTPEGITNPLSQQILHTPEPEKVTVIDKQTVLDRRPATSTALEG